MVRVEIERRRLAAPSTCGLFNRELECRDAIIQTASERVHVKRTPVTVLGSDAAAVAGYGVTIHDHLG